MARDKKIALMHRIFGVETGRACGECINFISRRYRTKVLRKCAVYGLTHSEASDWARSWTACKMFGQTIQLGGENAVWIKIGSSIW